MLDAARERAAKQGVADRCVFLEGTMEQLPVPAASFDLVVAQGVWNLARSDLQLVAALAEAARVARTGAGLFVFTFSRNTLAKDLCPLPGQRQIYDQFSGTPQAFVTEVELDRLLASAGFHREVTGPLTEYNRKEPPPAGTAARAPVIWEGTWVRR
jgi:ubiquinone/menaquinone biosynthesis C-methylase UbiE